MVGFLQSTTTDESIKEEKKEDIETQLISDSKKPSLPDAPLENCIPELEELSEYFSDSFLDFDSIDRWFMEGNPGDPYMADLGGAPVDFNSVGGELGDSKENLEVCSDGICMRDEVKEGFAGKEAGLKQDEVGNGVLKKIAEMCSGGVCENVIEKGVLGGDESSRDLGGLGCLIEEQLGKVSLDGELMKKEVSVDDVGESGSDVESESKSSSASSSASSSSSSSASSSSDEDEEDEDSGEMSNEKKSKGIHDEHTDVEVEDGEITLSDADEMVTWGDDEYADDDGGSRPIKSKNELQVLPPVPPVNVTLEPHHQTLPVGIILSIIETQVIVEGIEKHNPLSEGSILWITDSRSPLGIVDEIFGPVKNPYYIVRYNSESEVPSGIQHGTLISFVQEYADHVLNDKSLYQKGYDASNENDEEVSDDLEFSDDEKEAEYRRSLKMKKRGTNESMPGNKRKDKRQQKNQKGSWNRNQNDKLPVISEDQQFNPPAGTSSNQENRAMVQPFSQGPQAPGVSAPNRAWSNGFPHPQQQQGMNLPTGLPDGMLWMQQNLPNQLYQAPLQTNLAFQQQIGMIPGLPLNFNSMGGQPSFGGGPSPMPWLVGQGQNGGPSPMPWLLGQGQNGGPSPMPWLVSQGQNAMNPMQFGMGLQGQQPLLPVNGGGEQQVQSQGPQNMNFNQGGSQGSQNMNFNQGRGGHRGGGGGGRRGNHRGRGRFGGGRGRQS